MNYPILQPEAGVLRRVCNPKLSNDLKALASRLPKLSGENRARLLVEALNLLSQQKIHGSPKTLVAVALYIAAERLGVDVSMYRVAKETRGKQEGHQISL